MQVRTYQPHDGPAVERLFDRRRRLDGRPALSEHKAMRFGTGASGGAELVVLDPEIAGYAQAATHRPSLPGAPWRTEIEVVVAEGVVDEGAAPTSSPPVNEHGGTAPPPVPAAPVDPTAVARAVALVAATLEATHPTRSADEHPEGHLRTLWAWRPADVAAAIRLGMSRIRRLAEMRRPLPVSRPTVIPDGVVIRPFRVGIDEDAWLEVNNAAFAGHPENGALDRHDLAARMAQPWFDPEGFLMAWEGGALLGSCWTKLHGGGAGEIYIVGVSPRAQGRGLGTVLALAALDDLAVRQGASEGFLFVDGDDGAALRFYEALGFSTVVEIGEYLAS